MTRLEYLTLLMQGYSLNGSKAPQSLALEFWELENERFRLAQAERARRVEALLRELNWKADEYVGWRK